MSGQKLASPIDENIVLLVQNLGAGCQHLLLLKTSQADHSPPSGTEVKNVWTLVEVYTRSSDRWSWIILLNKEINIPFFPSFLHSLLVFSHISFFLFSVFPLICSFHVSFCVSYFFFFSSFKYPIPVQMLLVLSSTVQ